ncbi:MAG TPA: hypothetical protein VFL03_15490 [Candidatus Limnocylindrales bacterium]|jgi:hypothetical protein|nr:hypothetical protein [Candidatus Limnocylindrales bacterium]
MTNPRDPEGLMPEADVSGGPEATSPFQDAAETSSAADPLRDRTDLDEFGSDPDVRFPGDAEDPTETTADATANATHPGADR